MKIMNSERRQSVDESLDNQVLEFFKSCVGERYETLETETLPSLKLSAQLK